MKKSIAVLVAGATFLMVPAAHAEPVKITGEVSVKYEKDTNPDLSGAVSTLKLKGEADLGKGWSLYGRLGIQNATKPDQSDFNLDAYGSDKKSVISFDQFGLNYQGGGLTYKIGRQDATVGTTALLYSRPDSNIGKKNFVDGVSITGKSGVMDISALLAREDNVAGTPDNKIYAFRAGYNPAENVNWGVTLGRYQDSDNSSTNHWAVDGTYTFGKSSLTGEYTNSNRDAANKAYAMTWNYDFDGKTSAYITGFRVETNADMGGQSDFDNDNRGIHYGLTYKLTDTANLDFVYKDQKSISDGQKNTAFEAAITYSF